MGFKLADAYVEIGATTRSFDSAVQGVKAKLGQLASMRFSMPGGGFLGLLGGVAIARGIEKTIAGASDLAETLSKVGVTFGPQSAKVVEAADEMAIAFGIPKREFLDAASQFGLIATGMGQTEEQASKLSIKMAKLAADSSSFYNVPVSVALEKIRAGLTGESEPLKAFGVIMDETTMKAKAVAMGLVKKGQELNNAAKLAARTALIEQGLAAATGDLARTQDGASNQARQFWGNLQNLGDVIGTVILPAANEFLHLLNQIGSDAMASAQSGISAFQSFADGLKDTFTTAGIVYKNWGDIVERTGVMVGGWIVNVGEYISHLGDVSKAFLDWFGENWPQIFADAFEAVMTAGGNFSENIKSLIQEVKDYVSSGFRDPIEIKFKPLLEGFEANAPALKLPELKLSNVNDQIAAIDNRINQKAMERQAKIDEAMKVNKANAGPAVKGGAEVGATPKNVGITDTDTYAKDIQEAALKATGSGKDGDTVQDKMLSETENQSKQLDKLIELFGKSTTDGGKPIAVFG